MEAGGDGSGGVQDKVISCHGRGNAGALGEDAPVEVHLPELFGLGLSLLLNLDHSAVVAVVHVFLGAAHIDVLCTGGSGILIHHYRYHIPFLGDVDPVSIRGIGREVHIGDGREGVGEAFLGSVERAPGAYALLVVQFE